MARLELQTAPFDRFIEYTTPPEEKTYCELPVDLSIKPKLPAVDGGTHVFPV
jgi:hypothetical protein